MAELKASFINEIEKVYKKKKALLIIILSIFAIVIGQLVVFGFRFSMGSRGTDRTEFPLLILSMFANTILPLFTILVSIDIFAGEFSQNTMKVVLIRPASRIKLFTSKIAAIVFFIMVNLLVVMVLSIIGGILFNPGAVTFTKVFRVILSYLVTVFPMTAAALMIVFLANLLKSGTTTFFICIIILVVSKFLELAFGSFKILFITSMFSWYSHWMADKLQASVLSQEFLIMIALSLMFFTAGFYLFDKKDI
ncbi:MAG: ABC transporter permease [Bacillota bacterium]|nr:ABC transporter permease [Bacillota bacterium]